MRPVILTLGVLIRDPVNDNAWPGVDEVIEFNDTTCPAVEDEETKWLIEQVFVVMGYDSNQGDSIPAPAGWQIFTVDEARYLIPGWLAESLEFHAATKIMCSNDPDNFYVVGNSYFDVVNAFNVCCGTPNIQTQALVFKQSNYSLNPDDELPPCGAEAQFKWLAIRSASDIRNLIYTFRVILRNTDLTIEIVKDWIFEQSLPSTQQLIKQWPADFIGELFGSFTLVANDVVPGVNEYQVRDFDNGTIVVTSQIIDADTEMTISMQEQEFILPGTDCDEAPSSSGSESGIFDDSFGDEFM